MPFSSLFNSKTRHKLYCITNKRDDISYEEMVEMMCKGGADIIQFRAKELDEENYLEIAKRLKKITEKYNIPLIINDKIDIAISSKADGVHFGQNEFTEKDVERLKKLNLIFGISTHSLQQAVDASKYTPTYISIGPIFSTPFKPNLNPLGVKIISEIKQKLKTTIVAIGGINKKNIEEVIAAGADIVAVIRAICEQNDITKAVEELKAKMLMT